MSGLTDQGKRAFGLTVKRCRENLNLTQAQFASLLSERTNIVTKEHHINLVESAKWTDKFGFNTLFALHNAKVLKHPDGEAYSFNDMMRLLQGETVSQEFLVTH
ncbi:hypothetical protein NIES2135_54250 [Leptolyngbya boryana NIES-2135]|jgi:transcriptional regulator with XRE-family HTH domain|uniref:Uncharacterized protein n=1 Tax=Leptolyngbya boryana NIES-2135 TaxID=1973484 RepID=A0A1Z4JP96_LEPBY|nr:MULTISPECIES: hypothetical protein [Leptolyngbya]BAY58552.1 hypothetical protein NIES2135_54250 [Leptolyngbya boryana NIES-2135]MBD2370771.1 hypothetical protein [Leptolyngbya sp. FACHB-161]MBD2377076.1 hypothetical protein [Leptolyngbya sp. FACHB-238]MBD2401519.1 hypothetical protein [Leptolyngbya sp. FACHB-239]MBD2408071.1 hypothetical protein [Leptolyngbya sp. FACHB-402]